MKIIIYSKRTYTYAMGFETELELITDHLEKGDEVFILTCCGELQSCTINPYHKKNICLLCQSRFHEGIKRINIPAKNISTMVISEPSYDLIPKKFNDLSELKNFELHGVDFGMATASSIITETGNYLLDTKLHADFIYKKLKMSYAVYQSFLRHVKRIKPDLVYLINGRYAEDKPVIRICEKMGITYYTIEKASSLGKYILFKNSLPHNIDYMHDDILRMWGKGGKEKRTIAENWYISRRNGKTYPKFTAYQQKGYLPKKFERKKKNIGIFISTIDEYEGIHGWDNPFYVNEIEGIKKIAKSLLSEKSIKIYVRAHPNLLMNKNDIEVKELKKVEDLNLPNLEFIWPKDKVDTYDFLEKCSIVLTFKSTVGIEACYWGKPSILAGRTFYERLNCCYTPKTHDELIGLIKSDLKPKNKLGALMFAYHEVCSGIPFKKFKQLDPVENKFSRIGKPKFEFKFLNNTLCIEGTFFGRPIMPNPNLLEKLYLFFLYVFDKNTYIGLFRAVAKLI